MSPLAITGIVLACILGGTFLGRVLQDFLPKEHLNIDSREVIKVGIGLIGTLTALVLGFMISSAKSSYDTQRNGLAQLSANLIWLDRILAHYGSGAKVVREMLKAGVDDTIQRNWGGDKLSSSPIDAKAGTEPRYELLYEKIEELAPKSDSQRSAKAAALKTAADIGQTRWQLFAQKGSSIPTPFLIVIVFWLTLILASLSLIAPRNLTSLATLFFCVLTVSSALFLILELDQPFQGVFQISSEPLREALTQLGR